MSGSTAGSFPLVMSNTPHHPPDTQPQDRYRGRHRKSGLTPTALTAVAAATMIGTGLTAAGAAGSQEPDVSPPAVADASQEDRADRFESRPVDVDPTFEDPLEVPLDAPEPNPADDEPEPEPEPEEEPEPETPDWVLPTDAPVSDVYGPRAWRGGEMHNGLDFAAPQGQDIRAAASGVVVSAGHDGGYGLALTIDNGDGIQTLYAHHSELYASVGDEVAAGDVIGASGSTGDSTGPHLHFEVHVDGAPVDPAVFLEEQGVSVP